jgi:uncharacterized protein DUF4136
MRRVPIFVMTASALILAVPLIGKIEARTNKNADFTRFKTYEWLAPRVLTRSGIVENDDVVAPVIRATLDQQFAKVNLTKVAEHGDLQISTWALKESVPQVEGFIYANAVDWALGVPSATFSRYNRQGTLVVNLIDVSTKKSAWWAIATGTFDSLDQLESKVGKAVAEMFKKYPVKP